MAHHTVQKSFGSVRHRLAQYGEQVEGWETDHQLAMYCMEFELLLKHGLSLLEQVHRADEKIRLSVYRGEAEYDPQFDEVLLENYRWWLKPCDKLLAEIAALESAGFQVEYADEFRAACRDVRGILTNDPEFFSSENMVEVRDQAIDEYRAGECEPF